MSLKGRKVKNQQLTIRGKVKPPKKDKTKVAEWHRKKGKR